MLPELRSDALCPFKASFSVALQTDRVTSCIAATYRVVVNAQTPLWQVDLLAYYPSLMYDIYSGIHTDDPMKLIPGRIYRTADLKRWGANPTRMAEQLVAAGQLRKLRHGLYYRPQRSKWGVVPPAREEVLRALLKGTPFLVTGSGAWNALGLGSTSVFATPLVYNSRLSGEITIDAFRFAFRRVRYPHPVNTEWLVIDLIQNRDMAGLDIETLRQTLRAALRHERFDAVRLQRMADEYGTRETQALVTDAVRDVAPTSLGTAV